MTEVDLSKIIDLIQQLGIWIVFAWLYVNEKKAHQVTRDQYREDLREIANLRQNLNRVQTYVRDNQQVPSTSEMQIPTSSI